MTVRRRADPFLYWFLVTGLLLFGVMGLIGGYGVPFLVMGLTLALLAGVRDRPAAFRPVVLGVLAFMVAYALVGPLGCTVTTRLSASGAPARVSTTCTRLLLPDVGSFAAAFWPALIASAGIGAVAAWAIRLRMVSDNPDRRSPGAAS